ncbi:MAG: PaaI family thioesterase [Alphaproteobacteria bacterium]
MTPSDTQTPTNRAEAVERFISRAPFAQTLGMRCDIRGDQMTAILPFREALIGNAAIRALHGGAMGAFLELTAMAQVFLESDLDHPPRPIDITIDYLRQGQAGDLYARARLNKIGRRMASVTAEAWQAEHQKPVAALHGHFLVSGEDA